MKHKTSFSLVFVSRIVIALTILFVALPVVGAQNAESASVVETQDAFSAAASVPGARFVHTATAANSTGHATYIDHPLTNEDPNAIVLVTPNSNPGGVLSAYEGPPIGVRYNNTKKKWGIFNQDNSSMPVGAAFNVLIPATGADVFVHASTAANTTDYWTAIDHLLTNNNPNAIVLVTQNWNPGGVGSTNNNHPIGVWYNSSIGKWAIFNQDFAAMPTGYDFADFNVLIPPTGADVFVHTATAANVTGNHTYIDHPLTNENPNAIVLVTQNWNPGGVGSTYNDHPIGVWYSSGEKKWSIYNRELFAMPDGAAFNVLIPATGTDVFVHTGTAANITDYWTAIDHSLTNSNPNAIVLVTQNWNPGGGSGTYNDYPIGVWYYNSIGKWAVFNQALASMPVGAAFNVLIPATGADVFVHIGRAGNITNNRTCIDHPRTNNDPNAVVLVTQNWNPSGVGSIYNDHPIGVWYSSAKKWCIFNQDISAMPDGAAFNVLIPPTGADVFVHTATAANITGNWTAIDHSLTNNNPNAIVLVTQNLNPGGGVGGTYNPHPIGVSYSGGAKKWAVFNQDLASMPTGADFNVIVIVVYKVHLPLVLRGT